MCCRVILYCFDCKQITAGFLLNDLSNILIISQKVVVDTILDSAKTGDGTMGDGRIFVIPVESAYTISSREEGL